MTGGPVDRRAMLHWLGGVGLTALVTACDGVAPGDTAAISVIPAGVTPEPMPTPSPAPSPSPIAAAPAVRPPGGPGITILSDSLGLPIIDPLAARSERIVNDWSIGGQTSAQIANRALGVTIRVADNVLRPGDNRVIAINGIAIDRAPNDNVSHRILSGNRQDRAIFGTIAGVRGLLSRTLPGGIETYRFVPDTDASLPVTIPRDAPFRPEFPSDIVLYIAGRNNFIAAPDHPEFGIDQIVADARRVFDAFPRVLVLAVSNSDTTPDEYGPDGSLYLAIARINAALAELAGDRYFDQVRVAKDRGLRLAGLTPDRQSRIDARHDVISHQLRRDPLHENDAGGDVYAQILLKKLTQLGW